jgi:hypothetical protein
LGFRFLSERAAQWLELRTGSALLAQQPREFGRGGISALANEANILEMAHKVAAKIKDIPVADGRDFLSGSFADDVALDDPSHAFSLIVINEVAHWIPFVRHSLVQADESASRSGGHADRVEMYCGFSEIGFRQKAAHEFQMHAGDCREGPEPIESPMVSGDPMRSATAIWRRGGPQPDRP